MATNKRLHHRRGKWFDILLGYKFLVIKDAFKTASKTFIIERFLILALSRLFVRTRLDIVYKNCVIVPFSSKCNCPLLDIKLYKITLYLEIIQLFLIAKVQLITCFEKSFVKKENKNHH